MLATSRGGKFLENTSQMVLEGRKSVVMLTDKVLLNNLTRFDQSDLTQDALGAMKRAVPTFSGT